MPNPPDERARLAVEAAQLVAPLADFARRLLASDVTGPEVQVLVTYLPTCTTALCRLATQLLARPVPPDIRAN